MVPLSLWISCSPPGNWNYGPQCQSLVQRTGTIYSKVTQIYSNGRTSPLNTQSPLILPKPHRVLQPALSQSGVQYVRKKKKSVAWLAPDPSQWSVLSWQVWGSQPHSSGLNPNPCGIFSWPTRESPFTPLLPWKSLIVPTPGPALSLLLPKPRGKGSLKTAWFPCNGSRAWVLNPGRNLPVQPHFFFIFYQRF